MLLELLDGADEWLLEVSIDLLLLEPLVTALEWLMLEDEACVLLETLEDVTGVLLEMLEDDTDALLEDEA